MQRCFSAPRRSKGRGFTGFPEEKLVKGRDPERHFPDCPEGRPIHPQVQRGAAIPSSLAPLPASWPRTGPKLFLSAPRGAQCQVPSQLEWSWQKWKVRGVEAFRMWVVFPRRPQIWDERPLSFLPEGQKRRRAQLLALPRDAKFCGRAKAGLPPVSSSFQTLLEAGMLSWEGDTMGPAAGHRGSLIPGWVQAGCQNRN